MHIPNRFDILTNFMYVKTIVTPTIATAYPNNVPKAAPSIPIFLIPK